MVDIRAVAAYSEEVIECRRHERGRAREGDYSPSLMIGPLPRKFLKFERFYVHRYHTEFLDADIFAPTPSAVASLNHGGA